MKWIQLSIVFMFSFSAVVSITTIAGQPTFARKLTQVVAATCFLVSALLAALTLARMQ